MKETSIDCNVESREWLYSTIVDCCLDDQGVNHAEG